MSFKSNELGRARGEKYFFEKLTRGPIGRGIVKIENRLLVILRTYSQVGSVVEVKDLLAGVVEKIGFLLW